MDTVVAERPRGLVPDLPRDAWVVLGGDALSAIGTGLTLPFLLIYFHSVRGISLPIAGAAVAMGAASSLIGNPVGGALADRFSARSTVALGLVISAGGSLLTPGVREAWQAMVVSALIGLGVAIVWPAQDALLAAVVPADRRSAVFSVRHATFNAGMGIGALAAALLVKPSSASSFELLYRLDAVSFLLFLPVLARLRVPAAGDQEGGDEGAIATGYRAVLADPVFRRILLFSVLLMAAGYGQYHSGFPAFATRDGGISPRALGLAFAANTFTVVGAQLIVLRLLTGWRRTAALRLVCLGWAVAWALTLLGGRLGSGAAAVGVFATAMVVFALAETALTPTLPAIVNDLAPDALRGRYNGLSTLSWTAGFLLGPVVAGVTLGEGWGTGLFVGLIVVLGFAALATRGLERDLPDHANVVTS